MLNHIQHKLITFTKLHFSNLAMKTCHSNHQLNYISPAIKCNTNKYTYLQYFSDVHVDLVEEKQLPLVTPISENLAICGDIGNPFHKNFSLFLRNMSYQFDKIFFVPGNHDYNCGSIYNKHHVNFYKPKIHDICSKFNNVYCLDNNEYHFDENIVLLGSTLWSNPDINLNGTNINDHQSKHNIDIAWLTDSINTNINKKIVILTHYVPSFILIEDKYKQRGIETTSLFATNLEYLIKKPIVAWLCGHTHSIMHCGINCVYCGVNAYWSHNKIINRRIVTKVITI